MFTFDQIVHAKAVHIGKLAVQATTAAGSGHPTTALSLAHIITLLMYHTMRWDPENPQHKGSDRLVLSEGHAVPIVYAACADIGVTFYPRHGDHDHSGKASIMTTADLMTLRDIHSSIDGHPNPCVGFPLFDAATGSLGQGLSVAAGLAAAARVDNHGKTIYCIIGDGESREGQIWEAMDFIADQKLTSVLAIFNCNQLGQSDWVAPAQSADALAAKAAAFGWKVIAVDGHDPSALAAALKQRADAQVSAKPLCIIARTVKGWGAPAIEGMGHHGTPVPEKDLAKILAELDRAAEGLSADKVTSEDIRRHLRIPPPLPVPQQLAAQKPAGIAAMAEKSHHAEDLVQKKKMSPRRAFGLALDALGQSNPHVVALDADVKNSTYSQDFAKHFPSHFFECRIAEQNMVSVGVGLAAAGKIPFISTFGKFFSRAFDQIEMAIIGGANIKLVGTHVGVTLAADGPSQMAVADVPFFRGIAHVKDFRGDPAVTILTPADAVSAYAMVLEMAEWPSAVYLRALRADVPVIYQDSETFPFGKFKVVKSAGGKGKKLLLVSNGYLVHTALKAAAALENAGLAVTVIDAYSLPFDAAALLELAGDAPILTIEDNYVGGIGSEIAEAAAKIAAKNRVEMMNVTRLPKSGKTPEDVLAYVHLAEADIIARAQKLANP